MNKAELVAAVAEKTGQSKAQAGQAVDAVFEAIAGTLKSGGEVRVSGYATFAVKERPARDARNPKTGETIKVPAKKVVAFKAQAGLKI